MPNRKNDSSSSQVLEDNESGAFHSIGDVAEATGISPDTIRVWERRYGLGASHKSATGRRQYTQSDLEHLQLIAALVNDGARIGEIADSERKTLEMLVRQRGLRGRKSLPKGKTRAVFVNPRHDYPQRIMYELSDEGALTASIGFAKGGNPRRYEFTREGN